VFTARHALSPYAKQIRFVFKGLNPIIQNYTSRFFITEKTNAYRVFVGRPEGDKSFETRSHRWENNIKMYLKATERQDMDWMNLAQDTDTWRAVLNTQMGDWGLYRGI
jgi:hypothetical protein